jgi:stage V sporulation protein B
MTRPFPVRESSILSFAELLARVLGLLFLARFVRELGLAESAEFRIALPLIGVVAAFGSIGLPQALTRLFAARLGEGGPVPRSLLATAGAATFFSTGVTLAALFSLHGWAVSQGADPARFVALLQAAVPLLVLMCISGSLRGMLLGLGSTYAPALGQVLEVGGRLVLLVWLLPLVSGQATVSGVQFGLLTLTVGEACSGLFLGGVLVVHLRRRGVTAERSLQAGHPLREKRHGLSPALWWRDLLAVLRMTTGPTGQSLLATLGYALELPLAHHWLLQNWGSAAAEAFVAEYSAIALPLLCAPMVLTDGMATALLPSASAERVATGRQTFAGSVRRVIGAVGLIALPTTAALLVLAPVLSGWFGAGSAALLLMMVAPLTLPLYLQAPLSSLLQAQGHSRALLAAGLCGDSARLGALWFGLAHLGWGRGGLALALACSVIAQTGMLLLMTAGLSRLRIPWRTLWRAGQSAFSVAALLLVAMHAPPAWGFAAHPLLWGTAAAGVVWFSLLLAEEITPHGLARLPWVGRPVGKVSERVVRKMVE